MILKSFKNHLEYEKRHSLHTIEAYLGDIRQFQSFLNDVYPDLNLLTADKIHIRSWVFQLMQTGVSTRSVHRKISSLNSLYHFAVKNGRLSSNPVNSVILPSKKKPLVAYHSTETIADLKKLLPEAVDYFTARDRCIPLVLAGTGIRRRELIEIKTEDLDLSEGKMLVHGKRNKERLLPLHRDLVSELTLLVQYRYDIASEQDGEFLFLTNKGKKLYPKYVYNLVERMLSAVTTANHRGPHTLRHTFATAMLNAGADLNAIKELLGHAGLSATQIYTHTSIEQLKRSYNKAHPRASE